MLYQMINDKVVRNMFTNELVEMDESCTKHGFVPKLSMNECNKSLERD